MNDPHIRLAVAALAMQSLISQIEKADTMTVAASDTATAAVLFADALLAELAKSRSA